MLVRNSKENLVWDSKLKKVTKVAAFLALNFLSLVIRTSLYLLVQGGYCSNGRIISCFLETKKGQDILSALAIFEVTFI